MSPGPDPAWGIPAWGSPEFPWGAAGERIRRALGPVPALIEDPPAAGIITHRVVGPTGEVDYPEIISGWSADETAPGGFQAASGTVEAERVLDQPGVYRYGSRWTSFLGESNTVVWEGTLQRPALASGVKPVRAFLKGDGWGRRLERRSDRLLYQRRGSSGFQPKNTEGFNTGGNGYYVQGEERYQLDTDGALRWHISKGTTDWATGDRHGFLIWAPNFGSPMESVIGRFAGHVHMSFANPHFTLQFLTAKGPDGAPTLDSFSINLQTAGVTDLDFDVTLDNPNDLLIVQLYRNDAGGTGQDLEIAITGPPRVNGIAVGDTYTATDVGLDIAGRLGMRPSLVDSSGANILPLDVQQGTYGEALDRASLPLDWRAVAISLGFGPVLDVGPWDSAVWRIADPEMPRNLIPLVPYDEIAIPFRYTNGSPGNVHVLARDVGLPMLPEPNAFGEASLEDPQDSLDLAVQFGQTVMPYLRREDRMAGDATITRVLDPYGNSLSSHLVHAGSSALVRQPDTDQLVPLRIQGLHRTTLTVEFTFDPSLAVLDSQVARRRHRLELAGLL